MASNKLCPECRADWRSTEAFRAVPSDLFEQEAETAFRDSTKSGMVVDLLRRLLLGTSLESSSVNIMDSRERPVDLS